jgi:hypothetical protein
MRGLKLGVDWVSRVSASTRWNGNSTEPEIGPDPRLGFWLPQLGAAERGGWPGDFTDAGIEAILSFFE